MKVLVVSNIYPPDVIGGYEVACLQAADGLIARGHHVRVLPSVPRRPAADDPAHLRRAFALADEWDDGAMGGHAVNHLMIHSASRFVSAFNVHVLAAELADFAPDVVYLHSLIGLGGLGLVACLAHLNAPWVWQLGDCLPVLLCSSRRRVVVPALAAEFSRKAVGRYVVVSRRVRDEVEAAGVSLGDRVDVVPYWITGTRPGPRLQYYRGGPLRVLSAGRVNREKGVDVLIEAAGLLRDDGFTDFSVDVYGKPADSSFADAVRARGLQRLVRLRGVRTHAELTSLYAGYDLLAFPTSPREPFGLVALEAAAAGCVPLISRDCGAAEWLVHGVHCLKADRTPESLASAIRDVADGRVDLARIARRAADAVRRDFHLDAVLPKIERALRLAADEGRGWRPSPAAAAEAYRLARMAEHLSEAVVQEEALACA